MLKRKREEEEEEEEEEAHSDRDKLREDGALRIRKSRLAARIERGNVLLHRALKLARGFERQKLGRRQKVAGENAQKLHRLKEEVIFLKQLELARAAENHLLKQLVRTKRIREAPAFVSLYGKDVEGKVSGPKSGAEANVVGRLVNSNPVREAIPGIMSGIYGCLGLDGASSGTNDRREKIVSSIVKASAEGNLDRGEGDRRTGPGHLKLFRVDKDHRTDMSSNSSGDDFVTQAEKLAEAASDPQESEEDDEMAQFNGRLASSSATDGSGFEQDEISRTRSLDMNGKSQPTGSSSSTPSPSLSPSPGPSSISPSPQPPQRSATAIPTPKPRSTKPPSNTTFLPSLTLGGYFSGSDSTSDADPDAPSRHQTLTFSTAPTLPQPRKNRRGQRARQQIAEKKYGSGAKHLQKQQQQQQRPPSKQGRDAGWDPRMGATDGAGTAMGKRKGKGKGKGWQVGAGRGLKATGANVEPVTRGKSKENAKSTVDGPVHPSWEAARKRKQQQTQSVTGLFRGKKISFD